MSSKTFTIYKITCTATDLVYVGKTFRSLTTRRGEHETNYRNRKDRYTNPGVNRIYAIAEENRISVDITAVEQTTDKQNACELELALILFYRAEDRCVNIRLPNPAQCGMGSVGTYEYRRAKHIEKKQSLAEY